MKQEATNLAMLKESKEERDKYSGKKREISPQSVADYKIFSRLHSLTVSEVAELSIRTNSRPRSDQIDLDDDNDDEFLSDCATSYGSVHESEQRISDEELPSTSAKRNSRIAEESIVNGNIRKSNEKSSDSIKMKGELVPKITSPMNTLDATAQKEDEMIMLHEHINISDEDEYHFQAVPSLPQSLSTIALGRDDDDESLAPNALPLDLLRTESVSELSKNSNSSWIACSLESLLTSLPSHRYPFLMSDNTQQSPKSYLHASAPFCIDCSEDGTSNNSVLQKYFYIDDAVLLPPPLKNQLLYNRGVERSSDATNSEFEIGDGLLGRKSEDRNEQFDYGLDFVPSMKCEGSMNARSIYPNLSFESSIYDGESSIQLDSESVASDFGPSISNFQDNIENTEFTVISGFNEHIYDSRAPNLISEENDLFLSCYDTLFENESDRGAPLIIPIR